MDSALKILLVEDSETDADLLVRFLHKEKIQFSHSRVWNKEAFVNALKENNNDIIIADHSLPQFNGMEAFRIAKKENKNIPFILVTGTVSENILIEYAKEGLDDYILKENLLRLPSAIERALSKKKIADLHKKLEIAHKDINDSINYAKKIQNAMLPNADLLRNSFPESFILFKPKDILSGDFYWFKKSETTFYIAAADCTGHGIPGALMSMIGIEKLNSMIIKTKEPSEILKRLNRRIKIALCQSTRYEHSNDGMDIALCAIEKESGSLKFAGANRHLWIIRKTKEDGRVNFKLEEIKGTKKAIGGLDIGSSIEFANHQVKLNKGDSFFISSDGFADQFGGNNKKKLMTNKFKQLLLSIQDIGMESQRRYINTFMEDWQGKEEQVDDMLVIGVRID